MQNKNKIKKIQYKYKITQLEKQEINNYIFPIAVKLTTPFENEDIELIISILTDEEKIKLYEKIKELKEANNYEKNKRIFRIIAIIIDTTFIFSQRKKNLSLNENIWKK